MALDFFDNVCPEDWPLSLLANPIDPPRPSMKFLIDQIAIAPRNPAAAKELIDALTDGAPWAEDHVTAAGRVFGHAARNEADLSFNYALANFNGGLEFEVLHYTAGVNWMQGREGAVSHLGMHCTADELTAWRTFFASRGICVAQEVCTETHTNPAIAGKRWYQYVIFDTREILGVDLKFIVRKGAA